MRARVLRFMVRPFDFGCSLRCGLQRISFEDELEIVFGADLAAFEVDFDFVGGGVGGVGAAEGGAGGEGGEHFEGFDAEGAGGEAGGVAAGDDEAAELDLFEGGAGELAEGGADGVGGESAEFFAVDFEADGELFEGAGARVGGTEAAVEDDAAACAEVFGDGGADCVERGGRMVCCGGDDVGRREGDFGEVVFEGVFDLALAVMGEQLPESTRSGEAGPRSGQTVLGVRRCWADQWAPRDISMAEEPTEKRGGWESARESMREPRGLSWLA